MAKSATRGIASYLPTLKGAVKIIVTVIVLRFVVRVALPYIPPSLQQYVPVL